MALEKREKTLLLVTTLLVVILAGLFGYNQYKASINSLRLDLVQLKLDAERAEKSVQKDAELSEDKEWLSENEPPEMEYEDLLTQLKERVFKCATQVGIGSDNLRNVDPIRVDDEMQNYRRAQFSFVVQTNEALLKDFLLSLHSPKDSRAVISVETNRATGDTTQIITKVLVEQWCTPIFNDNPE